MNDLISRQMVIDVLNVDAELLRRVLDDADIVGASREKYEWGLELIESYIYGMKELPSAQQWDPLSTNQLPEEGQQVFIQFKEGRHCPHFKIQVGYLGEHDVEDNNFRKIGVKKVWYTNQYYYDLDMVIAWMPQPEPYEPERSEE